MRKKGNQFTVTDNFGKVATFEYESGHSIFVPQTLTIEVPDLIANPNAITDGQTFTVSDGSNLVTFEFDSNSNFGNTVPVSFTLGDTRDDIADSIVTALGGAGLGLTPVNLGDGLVHLGSRFNHSVILLGSALELFGTPQGVADRDTFTIEFGPLPITFEFDSGNNANPLNQRIQLLASETHEQLADRIVTAIEDVLAALDPSLALTPIHLGDGHIQLADTATFSVDTGTSSNAGSIHTVIVITWKPCRVSSTLYAKESVGRASERSP